MADLDLRQLDPPPRRILAVKLSSFGDIVHATPALHALAAAFPEARLELAVESRWRDVVRHDPHVHGILEASSRTSLTLRTVIHTASSLRKAARRDGPFDIAFDFQGTRRSAAWVYLSGARVRTGRGRVRPGWRHPWVPDLTQHAVRVCAALCEEAGVPVSRLEPRLYVGPAEDAALDVHLTRAGAPRAGFVLLNPFSRWPSKSWPVDAAAELVTRLEREWHVQTIVTGGPDERDTADALLRKADAPHAISLAGALSLGEALCLYRRARLMISCDSGPMHAAAAFDVPVLALFGPTHPERTGPWGTRHTVLQAARPASHHAYRDEPHGRYMAALCVDTVFDAAAAMLAAPVDCAVV
jgi:ADP-heptose:LPS heptosyltransferase